VGGWLKGRRRLKSMVSFGLSQQPEETSCAGCAAALVTAVALPSPADNDVRQRANFGAENGLKHATLGAQRF
jgi:hypothetical protein